jgi:citrate lyase synthetase
MMISNLEAKRIKETVVNIHPIPKAAIPGLMISTATAPRMHLKEKSVRELREFVCSFCYLKMLLDATMAAELFGNRSTSKVLVALCVAVKEKPTSDGA